MKLSYKLFLSYLLVIVVSLFVALAVTWIVAPRDFAQQIMHQHGQGLGRGMMPQRLIELDAQLDETFRSSVSRALVLSAGVATLVAFVISWLMSRRIVTPIRSVVQGSERIADGHYAERLAQQSNDELGHLVHSFNRMAASLEATETMRRQLLADVTHELKTPLSTIKGYMEGLQDEILPATPETFQTIQREAARLQRLVQDLQELSQVEAGQTNLRIQSVDTGAIVQAVVTRMQPQFEAKGIVLQTQLPAIPPLMRADRDRAEQVLTNLLGNALQYTPTNGTVTISLSHQHPNIHITVQDTGIGLTQDDIQRIFQRFYRVDKSRSRVSGGSGIGLTIAKHLIEAQGGQLYAASPGLGQGSTFHILLPAA